jgi:succinate dehydrogenase/fumarate reductase flavoprotein subunit
MKYAHIKTDVLIMGCGTAGANAAIAAARKGAKVVVMDKGKIERSGSSGTGQAHFLGFAHQRGSWDSSDGFLAKTLETSKGAVDLSLVEAVICSEMDDAIRRLDRLGLLLRWPDGTFWRLHRFGIYLDGRQLKPKLASEIRKHGCTVLDKTTATDLIVRDGVVGGAIGFNIRSGELCVIEAKATIVSTGLTNQLFENPSMNPFNTVFNPCCTGDGTP